MPKRCQSRRVGPERILTGVGMNHDIEFFGTKQVRCQPDNLATDVQRGALQPSVSRTRGSGRLTLQGNQVVFEGTQSYSAG